MHREPSASVCGVNKQMYERMMPEQQQPKRVDRVRCRRSRPRGRDPPQAAGTRQTAEGKPGTESHPWWGPKTASACLWTGAGAGAGSGFTAGE